MGSNQVKPWEETTCLLPRTCKSCPAEPESCSCKGCK